MPRGGYRPGAGRPKGRRNRIISLRRAALYKIGLRRGSHRDALYIIQVEPPNGPVKIGRARDVFLRWSGILYEWPYLYPLRRLSIIPDAASCELEVLRRFRGARVFGEWHRPTPELLKFARRCQDMGSLEVELLGPRLPFHRQ